jgi:hypothetical protein
MAVRINIESYYTHATTNDGTNMVCTCNGILLVPQSGYVTLTTNQLLDINELLIDPTNNSDNRDYSHTLYIYPNFLINGLETYTMTLAVDWNLVATY